MTRRAKGRKPQVDPPWSTFVESHTVGPNDDASARGAVYFTNSRYFVAITQLPRGWEWLSIKRHDKAVIRDWRELQRIKTELCGAEREALELYPAESRVVDTSNQFHLWVMPRGASFAFGWSERVVITGVDQDRPGESRQRPLPDYMPPTMTPQEAREAIRERRERGDLHLFEGVTPPAVDDAGPSIEQASTGPAQGEGRSMAVKLTATSPKDIAEEFERRAVVEDTWSERAKSAHDKRRAQIRAETFRECAAVAENTEIRPEGGAA